MHVGNSIPRSKIATIAQTYFGLTKNVLRAKLLRNCCRLHHPLISIAIEPLKIFVITMSEQASPSPRSSDKVEIAIHLDPELLDQIQHLTTDPSKVIETAVRQWLRGESSADQELSRTLPRNPPVPPRGEWND
jgi:hypothetical protein